MNLEQQISLLQPHTSGNDCPEARNYIATAVRELEKGDIAAAITALSQASDSLRAAARLHAIILHFRGELEDRDSGIPYNGYDRVHN